MNNTEKKIPIQYWEIEKGRLRTDSEDASKRTQ